MTDETIELPITFRVRCSGALHRITLSKRGNVVLHDHPELLSDEVMAVLSNEKCRCLQVRDDWYGFAREGRPKSRVSKPRLSKSVPAKLPNKLARYGAVISGKSNERQRRAQDKKTIRKLYGTSLSEPRFGNHNGPADLIHVRMCKRCEDIAQEANAFLTYATPMTHKWAEAIVDLPMHRNTLTRPTFNPVDRAVYSPDDMNVILSITRSLRWHAHPILMFRAYTKARCILRDEAGRIIATSAVGVSSPGQPDAVELFYAARQNDNDLTIEGSWCLAQKGISGLWEVQKWLPQPPRSIVRRSLGVSDDE